MIIKPVFGSISGNSFNYSKPNVFFYYTGSLLQMSPGLSPYPPKIAFYPGIQMMRAVAVLLCILRITA